MKKLIGLFSVFSLFYTAHTQQVSKEFNHLLVDDDFTRLAGKWNQQSNADNLFIGTERGFQVWRKNSKSGFFLLPDKGETYSVFETMVHFTFDPGSKSQTAGIVMQAQADGSGAIIVEINRKKQYRIRRAVNNRLISLTGDGEGWVKNKKAITNEENEILVRTYDKIYDLFINGTFIRSFTEIEYSEGQIGLYIGSSSKVVFHRLSIKTDDDHVAQKSSQNGPVDEEKTLSQVIVKLKEAINKKDKRIAELEADLRNAGARGANDTTLIRQKNEANSKLTGCQTELESLKLERESLQSRVANLEAFKEMIKQSENGDVIINLTKLTATQKEQIEQLQATLRAQNLALDQIKQDKEDLQKQINSEAATSDQLRNEKVALMQRLIEKDSIINSMEVKLKLLDEALTACSSNKPANPKPAKTKKQKKAKKKEEPILFDE